MAEIRKVHSRVSQISWLADVQECRLGLSPARPVRVQSFDLHMPDAAEAARAELHNCCEIRIHRSGVGRVCIGAQEAPFGPGHLLLLGPGIPHRFIPASFPLSGISMFFLPGMLSQPGTRADGVRILRRFTARQRAQQRVVRPPDTLYPAVRSMCERASREALEMLPGYEMRLSACIMDVLVELLRWELARPTPEAMEMALPPRPRQPWHQPVGTQPVTCHSGRSQPGRSEPGRHAPAHVDAVSRQDAAPAQTVTCPVTYPDPYRVTRSATENALLQEGPQGPQRQAPDVLQTVAGRRDLHGISDQGELMWVDGDPRFNGPQTTESWSTERKSMGSRSSGTQGWQCQPGPPSVLDEKPPADRLLCDLDRKHNLAVSDWPPNWRCVSRALTYIETHYCERVYACDIAKAVGLSESRLKALFQSTLQMPWTQYLQAYRVQEAINLIVSGQCNISEAATAVGFKSLSHFNVTFRALQGSSPSEYLKTLLVGVDKPHIG